jgi:hypothetical protein
MLWDSLNLFFSDLVSENNELLHTEDKLLHTRAEKSNL